VNHLSTSVTGLTRDRTLPYSFFGVHPDTQDLQKSYNYEHLAIREGFFFNAEPAAQGGAGYFLCAASANPCRVPTKGTRTELLLPG
jgi:hypothetical protein